MLALYRSGRQAEALQAFQAARRTLGEELGIDPSPRLRQLETEILRQAPALDWTLPLPGEAGQPPVVAAGPPVAAPATLPPLPAGEGELVGREEQLIKLNAALTAATAERGRVVLTAGEPGIGKTRLAEEMARRAAAQDVGVAWGRCYQGEGAPAFWPWEQITRGLLASVAPGELGAVRTPSSGELVQLLPELKELVPGLEPPPVVDMAAARFRLFQAVTGLLRRLADTRPLLLVVDDLHWADTGSLGLLAFLAGELRGARLVVLGTYRDVEAEVGGPLAETLGVLAREPVVERIALGGLGEAEVAQTVDQVVIIGGGRLVTQATLAALTARTDQLVRVRTPQAAALGPLLAAQGIQATPDGADQLVATGTTTETVGTAAAAAGIVIYEMRAERSNLEDVFLQLTSQQGARS